MCAEQEFDHTCTWRMVMNVHVCRMWMQVQIRGLGMVAHVYTDTYVFIGSGQ
jgi:hypothetical protein